MLCCGKTKKKSDMSSYLEEADSDSEETARRGRKKAGGEGGGEGDGGATIDPESQLKAIENAASLKQEGNVFFGTNDFANALLKYTAAVSELKSAGCPSDCNILLNRSATYLALKRYVPALHDASQAAEIDPSNWKSHWRKGVALMSMTKKTFRSKQAIEAFEKCKACESLPANKVEEVQQALDKARERWTQQDAEVGNGMLYIFTFP